MQRGEYQCAGTKLGGYQQRHKPTWNASAYYSLRLWPEFHGFSINPNAVFVRVCLPRGTTYCRLVSNIPSNPLFRTKSKSFDEISYYQNWLVLRDILNVQLFDLPSKKMIEANADSVWFERNLAFVNLGNARKVYLSATHSIDLQDEFKINFIAFNEKPFY